MWMLSINSRKFQLKTTNLNQLLNYTFYGGAMRLSPKWLSSIVKYEYENSSTMVLILWNFSTLSSKSFRSLKKKKRILNEDDYHASEPRLSFHIKTDTIQLMVVISDQRSCPDLRPGAPKTVSNSLHSIELLLIVTVFWVLKLEKTLPSNLHDPILCPLSSVWNSGPTQNQTDHLLSCMSSPLKICA